MANDLAYRTALVTGASRGIGLAVVHRLRGLGLKVHGVARDATALSNMADTTGATAHACDVTDTAALERLVAGLEIDVLVNNAGYISSVRPLAEQSADEIDRMLDVNLRAPLHLMRLVLPGMIARSRGHIINITSTAAHHVLPGTAPYGAAKSGLSRAGLVTRYDIAGSGVRLSEIAPGRVATDIYMEAFGGDRDRLKTSLFDDFRTIEPEAVADAVAAVLSLPEHVNASHMELSPTDQATGGQVFAKRPS
jgi:3-hydroxy acid dehydrogenase / malonic semialdehyde reductase